MRRQLCGVRRSPPLCIARSVYLGVVLFLFGAIYYVGNQTLAGFEHLTITAMLLPIGLLLYRMDTMPLIYGFILHDKLFEIAIRVWIMYT